MKNEIVASYPAYDFVKPNVDSLTNLPLIKAYDTVAVMLKRGRIEKIFTFCSVVSSALKSGDDPIAEYNRAVGFGHDLHFAFPNAVVISANEMKKETHYYLELGDKVLFEGIVFRIEEDWNNNLKLVKVATKDEVLWGGKES